MFEGLGLNVARQEDNGANPRPDNRSGWLEGETPEDADRRARGHARRRPTSGTRPPSCGTAQALGAATARRRAQPRPRSPTSSPPRSCPRSCMVDPRAARDRRRGAARRASRARALPAHAGGVGAAGPARAARRPAGAAALLEQLPRAGRPPARARGGRRGGHALRRRRRGLAPRVGQHDDPPPPGGAAGRLQGRRRLPALRLGLPRERRAWCRRWPARATSCSPTPSTTRASSTAAAWPAPRPSSTTTWTWTTSSGACARPRAAAR